MPDNELPAESRLQTAVGAGNLSEVHRLCEQGADDDEARNWGVDFRSSLLYTAIETYVDFSGGMPPKVRATGHTDIVAYLLKRGANPNYIKESDLSTDNQTPLHWAARYGYKDIAALLIQNGADVDAKWEAIGLTPLALAVDSYTEDDPEPDEETEQRIFDTIRLLVDKGADVNSRNNTKEYPDDIGDTILHRIAGGGALVQYLVDNGADINARNNLGWTPLHHIAAYVSGTHTARALILAGADVNAKDNSGKTPLDLARSDEMKALLQSHQAPTIDRTSTPETVAKSGCMGVLAVIGCLSVVLVMLVLVDVGSSNRRAGNPAATQPAYGAALNTSTVHVSSQETNTSRALQEWRGEHFPQTRNGYLREADIQGWSYSGVRYALNEMYARHGYSFKNASLSHQFHKFSWYHPSAGQTSADIEAQFTPVERANQILLAERHKTLVQAGKAIK